MALYAFDGTGNEDEPGTDEDTNVLKFYRAYEAAYEGPGKCFYVEGVGTRLGLLGAIFGGLFGAGGRQRVQEALEQVEENFQRGDRQIDIVGFSRGAALAMEFANEVHDEGVNGIKEPEIRFTGIWDTVASFGLPGNNINLSFDLTVPKNVTTCCHAISLDERRMTFPLTRMVQDAFSDRTLRDIREVWFRGYHSDIGGGNKNEGLSNIALHWMCRRALDRGVKLESAVVQQIKNGCDPTADCKTPGMDRVPSKKRTIRENDLVHDSVTRRPQAGKFDANNPPRGLRVVNDAGELLPNGFGE